MKPCAKIVFCWFFGVVFLLFCFCNNNIGIRCAYAEVNHEQKEYFLHHNFVFDGEKEAKTFKIREDAKKYIMANGTFNEKMLSLFLEKAYNKGIMPEYALEFCFEDFSKTITDLIATLNKKSENAKLEAIKNTGKVYLKSAIYGKEIEKTNLIFDIFYNLIKNTDNTNIKYKTIVPDIENTYFNDIKHLRGKFYTTYSSSSPERKQNIEKALLCFDGLTLMPGEILSFNKTTGKRNEENGYKGAKIIVNGEFVDGLGGGVCQASTTLYNACLVSGLEILEANQHSLKVGYIAPSFDAMVNTGSSDLIVRNNTPFPITFATKCDGTTCEVFVYGEKNDYKIVRRSEVLSEKLPEEDDIIFASEDDENLKDKGFYYKTYPKNEVVSEGYLDYYKNGKLEKSLKIRHNKYNGVKGVKIVKNSNYL